MSEIYEFKWPVDRNGYEVRRKTKDQELPGSPPLMMRAEFDVVVGRGGTRRFYHPMDNRHLGLWRTFAESCTSAEGVMSFVWKYGLLSHGPDRLDGIIHTAAIIAEIAEPFQAGRLDAAASRFNRFAQGGVAVPVLVRDESKGQSGRVVQWELKFAPRNLFGALLLQIGAAISGNQKFRQCRNEGCTEWFRVGREAATVRRQFCSDVCRAASARRQKQKPTEQGE